MREGGPRKEEGAATDRGPDQALRESEELFRAFTEEGLDVVTLLEPDGTIRYESPSVKRILGYDPDELVGRNVFDLFHPDDIARIVPLYQSVLDTPGETIEVEVRFRHRSGSWCWLEARGRYLPDNPVIAGLVVNSRDITVRKQAEERLRTSEERFRLVTRATSDLIYDWNVATGEMLWAGDASALGYDVATMPVNVDWWKERIHPEDREAVLAGLGQALEGGSEFWAGEYRWERPDGSYAPVYDRGYVLRDEDGAVSRMIGSVMDLTERRTMEEQLRQAQKMEAVGRLAGGIAHDFNNLLTAIRGHAELLLADLDLDDRLREDAVEIVRSAERARGLTAQLLAFSRKQVLQPRIIDLNTVTAGLGPMLRRLLPADIELTFSLTADPATVEADPVQYEQAVLNLVLNARDAMPHGGRVDLRTTRETLTDPREDLDLRPGEYAVLTVADSGQGIAPELQKRVFEPFFTTKEVGKGTGLGLATVYGIVKQSGGDVRMDSRPGRGTTFRVFLPLARAGTTAPEASSPAPPSADRSGTVLVVEDEAGVRSLARRILERHGYTVLEAAGGRKALELLAAHGPVDLLLTDVVMPDMDGRRLVERLRCDCPDVRVIYMSGYTEDEVVRRGVAEGELFLPKPFGPADLVLKVRDALDRS